MPGEVRQAGLGWRVALLDMLTSVHHLSYREALGFPVATGLLLARHRRDVRADGNTPDNPLIACLVKARQRVRNYYRRTHRIVPNE